MAIHTGRDLTQKEVPGRGGSSQRQPDMWWVGYQWKGLSGQQEMELCGVDEKGRGVQKSDTVGDAKRDEFGGKRRRSEVWFWVQAGLGSLPGGLAPGTPS